MSSLNKRTKAVPTEVNEVGTPVFKISAEQELKRLTFAHMLFEDQFYIDGQKSADKLIEAVGKVSPEFAQQVALEARTKYKLRHVPLLITAALVAKGKATVDGIADVIQRADEMGELLAIYNRNGKRPLANKLRKGIAKAFLKFNEYQLAKNDKGSAAYSVRDVMFLTHPKPQNKEQADLFKRIADQDMFVPDTWETQLSAGADKKTTFENLMKEGKLGALAFLRNLRNMTQAGVPENMIREYAKTVDVSKVLPFRFIAAARVVPHLEDMLEPMMFKACESLDKLEGSTDIVVDVSGSMFGCPVSAKSDLDRFDAAAALAVLTRELCPEVRFFTFSNRLVRVPSRRGFALVEALRDSQAHSSTYLGAALKDLEANHGVSSRTIVITDEQSHDSPVYPKTKGYILNVGSYQNGINSNKWETVTGFSEATLAYIAAVESNQ